MDIIYQVLPRLYNNRSKTNVCNGTIQQNGCGKLDDFTSDKLQSIRNLGCSHIWFTGILEHSSLTDYSEIGIGADTPDIVKGVAGSPYAVRDYYSIDPDLATIPENRMEEFISLIERVHNCGLKLIIDFVPNHLARSYMSRMKPTDVEDLGERDICTRSFDRDNNFYYLPGKEFISPVKIESGFTSFVENPAKVTGNDCFRPDPSIDDWYETVKLNYGIDYFSGEKSFNFPYPDTWKKMCDILHFWAGMGVDGFRCDMAGMVPVEFWHYAISSVRERFSNMLFIAEIYEPDKYKDYLEIGMFDYLYDKVGMYDYIRAVICGLAPASGITKCWQTVDSIQDKMLYFLENHDEQRIASDFFATDPFKALPAMAVLLLLNRAPFLLYFGQEFGERGMDSEGYSGCDGKTSIFDYWSPQFLGDEHAPERLSLRNRYSELLNLAMNDPLFSDGTTHDLAYSNYKSDKFDPFYHFAFLRRYEERCSLIVVNFCDVECMIEVNIPEHAVECMQLQERFPLSKGSVECVIGARDFKIIEL